MSGFVYPDSSYEDKYSLLNRNLRWEVSELVADKHLSAVNEIHASVTPKTGFYVNVGKRTLDVIVSVLALILTLPLNAIGALVTLVDVGRPVIFSQKRLGRDGKLFTLHKFRNMREANDENGHPLPGEARVTRAGKFARKTSLDELLNFWCVLRGDMSIIGPRPLVPEYQERYSHRHRSRTLLRPGIECPPRRGLSSIASYQEQFENDIWYLENVSFRTDLFLLMRLIGLVFDRDQARLRSTAQKGSFVGYHEDGTVMDSYSIPHWALDEVLSRHGLMRLHESDNSL